MIDIDRMYFEMKVTMENNFPHAENIEEKYKLAKELFLESVAEAIEDSKEDLIKEVQE